MEASSPKPQGSFSFSRPQEKSSLFHTRTTTSLKTSNPDIFPSLNPFGNFLNNQKKPSERSILSSVDELQGIPLKKTKSENLSLNMLAGADNRFVHTASDSMQLGLLKEIRGAQAVKEPSKLTTSEQENIKGYLDNFYANEILSEVTTKESPKSTDSNLAKEESERKESMEPIFMPANAPNSAKLGKELYKSLFVNLIGEFEKSWTRQLKGLIELEKWYNTDVPFGPAVPEGIHVLLLDRLSRKLKIDQETASLMHKVQNVFEINKEYKDKFMEYSRGKGVVNQGEKTERKVEKTKVLVLDRTCEASSSKSGCKRLFQDLEESGKTKEIRDHA